MAVTHLQSRTVASLTFLWCFLIAATVLGGEKPSGPILNGGFESGQPDQADPSSWNATRVSLLKGFYSFQWDNEIFHSGRKSVSISVRDNHPEDRIQYNWNQAPLDCKPGASYAVTAWVKAQNLNETAFVTIQCWNRGMKKILVLATSADNTKVVGTTGWVQVRTEFTVPEETWRVVALLGIPGHSNLGGKVWFDDIEIVDIPSQ